MVKGEQVEYLSVFPQFDIETQVRRNDEEKAKNALSDLKEADCKDKK